MREIPDYFDFLGEPPPYTPRINMEQEKTDQVRSIEVDGRKVAFATYGPPDGKPVFLIPGNPSSCLGPVPRTAVLYHINRFVIIPNLPGFGNSGRHEDATIADIASKTIIPIADELELEKVGVLGRSGGTPVAGALGAKHPDRVVKVSLHSGLAPEEADIDWTYAMTEENKQAHTVVKQDKEALLQKFNVIAQRVKENPRYFLDEFLWPQLSKNDKYVISNLKLQGSLTASYAEALSQGAEGWVDAVYRLHQPWGFNVADISVPVLIWHGDEDQFSNKEHSRWLADKIPNSTRSIYNPHKGHFSAFDVMVDTLVWLHE